MKKLDLRKLSEQLTASFDKERLQVQMNVVNRFIGDLMKAVRDHSEESAVILAALPWIVAVMLVFFAQDELRGAYDMATQAASSSATPPPRFEIGRANPGGERVTAVKRLVAESHPGLDVTSTEVSLTIRGRVDDLGWVKSAIATAKAADPGLRWSVTEFCAGSRCAAGVSATIEAKQVSLGLKDR